MMKLNIYAFAMAMAIVWSIGVIIIAALAAKSDKVQKWVDLISSVYLGYESTLKGALIGGLWAFADGFISGYLIAWIYNLFVR